MEAKPKPKLKKPKRPKKPKLTREQKAQKMYDEGVKPDSVTANRWNVQGSDVYEVRNDHDLWSCSCPDFFSRGLMCKHILLVRLCAQNTEKQALEAKEAKTCETCLEARRNYGPATFSAGAHLWCEHSLTSVEKNHPACDWFLDRSDLIIVC